MFGNIIIERRAYLTLGFFLIVCWSLYGQGTTTLDSLESAYRQGNFQEGDRLSILKQLAIGHEDPHKKITFSSELIEAAQASDSIHYLYDGFLQKGNALRLKSDLTQALESFFQATEIAIDEKLNRQLGIVYIAIADVYSIMENHDTAINYYQIAIDILREENDSIAVGSALLNAGDEYFNQGKLDSAMIFFHESGEIFRTLNYEVGLAYNLGNIGMVYAEQGKDDSAKANMNEAINILEKLEDYYPISVYLTYISEIYLTQDDWNTALSYAQRSLELATRYGLKDQISDANLQISELYEQAGNIGESFKYYKDHTTYKDSVNNIVSVQQMANLRADFEIAQKQIEVDLLNQQKKTQRIIVIAIIIALVLIGLLALGLYKRNRFIQKTNLVIEEEKNRSENLLLNILPKQTAQELKEFGKVKANKFESVTVLFTDFEGFTHYSENLSPEELVEGVDFYYSKFDDIMEKYGLEKIKTVGDAYMCAGGLPFPTEDHASKMVSAAFEIAEFVNDSKQTTSQNGARFDIRIGINTGPVVAGVVGTKKFAYDIWGDAVNIASRMESNSKPGKINISENTYELIKGAFDCEYRGEIEVKNRGMMKMYFVNKPKSALS